jgi:hypothetical protein
MHTTVFQQVREHQLESCHGNWAKDAVRYLTTAATLSVVVFLYVQYASLTQSGMTPQLLLLGVLQPHLHNITMMTC